MLTAGLASAARADHVSVLVVADDPPDVGAHGLYVAGRGLYVSREEALELLEASTLPTGPCGAQRQCEIEIFVKVPQLAARRNTDRFTVAIRGEGYRGLLVSDSTRIPGLVAIDDIPETVRALELGEKPPIRARPSEDPHAELAALDARLRAARRAQLPATVALAGVLVALAALALLLRSCVAARAALAFPPLALLAAVLIAGVERTGRVETTVAVLAAAPLALAAGRLRAAPFALFATALIAVYGAVLALAPEANALSGIGPHPWNGGRFHGLTNQTETLLLAPALAAGAALRDLRLLVLASLTLVVVGTSWTGADGGGLIVVTVGFAALWFRLHRRRPTPAAAVVVIGALAAAIVLDAALGGSSHVVDTVRDGPGALTHAFERRLELSWSIVTSTIFQGALFVAGVAILAWLGTQRPRDPLLDAFLIAIAVSVVVNDSPTKVVGFAAALAGALRALVVCAEGARGRESRV